MNEGGPDPGSGAAQGQRIVLRNTLVLLVAQSASMPLSIVLSVVMARYLGAEDYGYIYLATTLTTLGMLAVEWGQGGALPARIARDPASAGVHLGSGLAYRLTAAVVVFSSMLLVCWLLNYDARFLSVLALSMFGWTLATLGAAGQDTAIGFERTDVSAIAGFAQQTLNLIGVVPVLLLGGRLRSVMLVQALTPALIYPFVVSRLKVLGAWPPSFDRETLKSLLTHGTPFVGFGLAMALQPNIDAFMLSHFSPPEAVGWYAAARRLIGFLVYPAGALIASLYPTLTRLHVQDHEGFRETLSSSLCLAMVFVGPAAFGCALFPELGVQLFSQKSFAPAADNLRILSVFLFLVYFTMVIGSALMASGRQKAWAWTQALCVLLSAILDPILVPLTQTHYHNGGLGVCIATVTSEVFMLGAGLWLLPKGVLSKAIARQIPSVFLAGGGMAIVAHLLRGLPPVAAAPVALVVYGAVLWTTGGVGERERHAIIALFERARRRRAAQ